MDVKSNELSRRESLEAPPSYDDDEPTSQDESSVTVSIVDAPASGGITRPLVVPQITKSFRGAFFSPFVRGYAPELEAHGISQADFLTMLDGLNECFVAHPVFQGLGIAGAVMGFVYGVQSVQWAGVGLQVAAGVTSAATSYARTRAYVKEVNRDLLHPAALHMNILTTKKMMDKVGYPEDKLQLPSLDLPDTEVLTQSAPQADKVSSNDTADAVSLSSEDPRMRCLKALEGYVMPLSLDVPDAVAPDTNNFLKKMGANQAARMKRKQEKKLENRRSKRERRHQKRSQKPERRQAKGDNKIKEMTADLEHNQVRLEELRLSSDGSKNTRKLEKEVEKENLKLNKKMSKTQAKADRKMNKRLMRIDSKTEKVDKKETKIANKVRWIVLTKWTSNVSNDSDEDSALEPE